MSTKSRKPYTAPAIDSRALGEADGPQHRAVVGEKDSGEVRCPAGKISVSRSSVRARSCMLELGHTGPHDFGERRG